MNKQRIYLCIDLKSFYASVECVERGLDPLSTNLVVADASRTTKTICLAVSPSLKMYGIPGRPRLFEVVKKVQEINDQRQRNNHNREFLGNSYDFIDLQVNPLLKLDYVVAEPRMKFYMDYSARIYKIYLKYISPEDIHVYSIDEVFIDLTNYLKTNQKTPHEMALMLIKDVLRETGITATAGIGTNMYLAKVAMDIVAKHVPADMDGARIAQIDEMEYRKLLWDHQPLSDFWRIGSGISRRLAKYGLYTMGDVARYSLNHEDELYKEFGINAELLIDHAWGWEPTLISDIKDYKPEVKSVSSGQVLSHPYPFDKARMILKEMTESLALDLTEKKLVTSQLGLYINYDTTSIDENFDGDLVLDYYGRTVPKPVNGSVNLTELTNSLSMLDQGFMLLYDKLVNRNYTIRRITVSANAVVPEEKVTRKKERQFSLFEDADESVKQEKLNDEQVEKDRKIQKTLLDIKRQYGRNAVFKAADLQEDATALARNKQVGGHKS